jgi:TolB-like protein
LSQPTAYISRLRPIRRALVAGLTLFVALSGIASAQEKPTLALLPVVVHSSENPAYVQQGLADMFKSRFDREGVFSVIELDDDKYATTKVEAALETARDVGAQYVLFGSFTRFGAGASMDMQVASTTPGDDGAPMREIFVHSGTMGEVIPDLTDLVGKITRFAVSDYTPPEDTTQGPAPSPLFAPPSAAPSEEISDLISRVKALEDALEELQDAAPASP